MQYSTDVEARELKNLQYVSHSIQPGVWHLRAAAQVSRLWFFGHAVSVAVTSTVILHMVRRLTDNAAMVVCVCMSYARANQ